MYTTISNYYKLINNLNYVYQIMFYWLYILSAQQENTWSQNIIAQNLGGEYTA